MEKITLNNNVFLMTLSIAGEVNVELQYDRVGQLAFSTTAQDAMYSIDFTYTENSEGQVLGRVVPDGTSMMVFELCDENMNGKLVGNFALDYVKATEVKGSTVTYRVRGVGFFRHQMEKNTEYFASEEDPIVTARNLLEWCGVNANFSEVKNGSGVVSSFISDARTSAAEQIDDLLCRASNNGHVFFLSYSMTDGELHMNDVGSANVMKKDAMSRAVPTSMFFTSSPAESFQDVSFHDGISLPLSYNVYNPMVLNSFDSRKRKWTRRVISDVSSMESSMAGMDGAEIIFKEQAQQKGGRFSTSDRYGDGSYLSGHRNRYAMTHFDVMDASMIGSFGPESGSVMVISAEESMKKKYAGIWFVNSVTHWFTGNVWTTKVLLSRISMMKGGSR